MRFFSFRMCLTCILVVEVSKCNGREDAGKIEEDGGRDGFLKYEHLVQDTFLLVLFGIKRGCL